MLANVYVPNSKQALFYRSTLKILSDFQEGIFILGGDFNVPLNPIQDTSTGTSSIFYGVLRNIKTQLQNS